MSNIDTDSALPDKEDSTKVVLTLQDLLEAESEVLKRVGREYSGKELAMAGHYSSTGGHKMGANHGSHTMAMGETPLVIETVHSEQE